MKIRGRVLGGNRPVRSEQDLSPDALAVQLAALQASQSELAHTIDLLASQIDALRENGSEEPTRSTSAPSEPQGNPQPNLAPPPPPPGFAVPSPISSGASAPPPPPPGPDNPPRSAPPPPPPPGIGQKPAPPPPPPGSPATPSVSPPPPSPGPTLSPLDMLLGEDFGKPRVASPIEAQPAPNTPDLPANDASSPESHPSPDPEPRFRVAPLGDEKEPAERLEEVESSPVTSANSQSPTATEPPSPFSFKAKLNQLKGEPASNGQVNAPSPPSPAPAEAATVAGGAMSDGAALSSAVDEPAVTDSLPAPDFFRSGGQSFASAAAMVNDILEATPDIPPESGATQVEESADHPGDAPRAPDVPITPDFFTAQPKKRFRLRR